MEFDGGYMLLVKWKSTYHDRNNYDNGYVLIDEGK